MGDLNNTILREFIKAVLAYFNSRTPEEFERNKDAITLANIKTIYKALEESPEIFSMFGLNATRIANGSFSLTPSFPASLKLIVRDDGVMFSGGLDSSGSMK